MAEHEMTFAERVFTVPEPEPGMSTVGIPGAKEFQTRAECACGWKGVWHVDPSRAFRAALNHEQGRTVVLPHIQGVRS